MPNKFVASFSSASEVIVQLTGHPAHKDWNNNFEVWDRGLLDCYAYDITREGTNHFRFTILQNYHHAMQEYMGDDVRILYIVVLNPISEETKDERDAIYLKNRKKIIERYEFGASTLASAGAKVIVLDNIIDHGGWLQKTIYDMFANGHTTSLRHTCNPDNLTVSLGSQ